jgi:hypothetical protein
MRVLLSTIGSRGDVQPLAERSRAQLWVTGRDGLEFLPANWRSRAGWPAESTRQR